MDASGNAYVAGNTDSDHFPVTPGAYQDRFKGLPTDPGFDAFVTRIVMPSGGGASGPPTSSPGAASTAAPSATETPTAIPTATSLLSQFNQFGQPIRCLSSCSTGFAIDTTKTTCAAGLSLAPGRRCRVGIFFQPTASGPATDALVVNGNMSNGASIPLSGIGR